jgi:hypothetical protein
MKNKHNAATFHALLVFLLLAAGCVNMLGPEPDGAAAFPGGTPGTFTLYITDGTPGGRNGSARTLYPGTPEWSRLVISFTPLSGQAEHAPVRAWHPSQYPISIDGLVPGTWFIEVAAYSYIDVDMNGNLPGSGTASGVAGGDWPLVAPDYEAQTAYGSSVIGIGAGNNNDTITLHSHKGTGTDQGYFALNVDLAGVSDHNGMTGWVKLWPYSNTADYTDAPYWDYSLALASLSTAKTELPTGDTGTSYYYMELVVQNNYQRIGHAEIVKIDKNLTTTMSLTLTDGDFVALKPLTGTITTPSGEPYTGSLSVDFPAIANFYLLIMSPGGTIMSRHQFTYDNQSDIATLDTVIPTSYTGPYKLLVCGEDASGNRTYFPISPPSAAECDFSGESVNLDTIAGGPLTIAELSAVIFGDPVTIGGFVGTAISQTELVIAVNADVKAYPANTPANGWITNLPAGLSAVTQPADEREFKLLLTGTPTAEARTEPLAIVLPTGAIMGVPIPFPVPLRDDVTFDIVDN